MTTRMSLQEFVNFVRSRPLADVAALNVEQLPDNLPAEMVRNAPMPLRGVLEKMAFDIGVRELREQQIFEQTFGVAASRAIDLAQDNETSIALAQLQQKIQDLAPSLSNWRQKKMTHYAMGQAMTPLREAVVEIQSLRARIARASLLLSDCEKLPAATSSPDLSAKIQKNIALLNDKARKIDQALGAFHSLHLEIIAEEMAEKHRQINTSDLNKKELFMQIEALEEVIRRPPSLSEKLMPWARSKQIEDNKQRLSELHQRILSEDWVMGENQLMRWLDVLVDASLYAPEMATLLEAARNDLNQLLLAFCEQQEAAARNVARNPFVQANPEQAIQFMLMSERMILDYFARKRAELAEWLGNAANDRLSALNSLEKQLISEMKRNLKLEER